MMNENRRNQLLRLFLVLMALCILTGELGLAGKPGGNPPKDPPVSTEIDPDGLCSVGNPSQTDPGLCPDKVAPYVNSKDGVRSAIQNGGYVFTTNFSSSRRPRTVSVNLDSAEFDGVLTALPIHLAIQWDFYKSLTETDTYLEGGMGGTFNVNGIDYRLRWGPADPFADPDNPGASPVRVTCTADDGDPTTPCLEWEIEPVGGQLVRLMFYQDGNTIKDLGLLYFPFKLVLTRQ